MQRPSIILDRIIILIARRRRRQHGRRARITGRLQQRQHARNVEIIDEGFIEGTVLGCAVFAVFGDDGGGGPVVEKAVAGDDAAGAVLALVAVDQDGMGCGVAEDIEGVCDVLEGDPDGVGFVGGDGDLEMLDVVFFHEGDILRWAVLRHEGEDGLKT